MFHSPHPIIMNKFELYSLAERYHKLINPMYPEKIVEVGRIAGMEEGKTVIEFGSGRGEVMALWAKNLGIEGLGIEIRKSSNDHGLKRIEELGLSEKVTLVNKDASGYEFEEDSYDFSCAIGTSFIWGGFEPTLKNLIRAAKPNGKLLIGEPYWNHGKAPEEFNEEEEGKIHTEREMLDIIRNHGYTIKYIVRSSLDEWDLYEANNWRSLIEWLEENPGHPERNEVEEFLTKLQNDYLTFGREHCGWAIYLIVRK